MVILMSLNIASKIASSFSAIEFARRGLNVVIFQFVGSEGLREKFLIGIGIGARVSVE